MVDLVKFFCIEFGLFGVKRPPTGGKEPGKHTVSVPILL